jgi:hypothetical protein
MVGPLDVAWMAVARSCITRRNHGFSDRITRPTFEAIITRSAEMDSANKVLAAGKELAGGKILPPALLGLSAEEMTARRAA